MIQQQLHRYQVAKTVFLVWSGALKKSKRSPCCCQESYQGLPAIMSGSLRNFSGSSSEPVTKMKLLLPPSPMTKKWHGLIESYFSAAVKRETDYDQVIKAKVSLMGDGHPVGGANDVDFTIYRDNPDIPEFKKIRVRLFLSIQLGTKLL